MTGKLPAPVPALIVLRQFVELVPEFALAIDALVAQGFVVEAKYFRKEAILMHAQFATQGYL